jgi:hypothetical protein
MGTPVRDRIRTAAIATPALTAILGTNPFRWYDPQLAQGSVFPAIAAQVVSDPSSYVYTGQLPTSWSRYQFTLSATNTSDASTGIPALVALESAFMTFLNSLNLIGVPNLLQYPNLVVAARDGFRPAPQPGIKQRILDVMIFANTTL